MDRLSHSDMAHSLDLMAAAKSNWLSRFSSGKDKRPDFEIGQKRADLDVIQQAAADYRAAANREAA